MGNWSAEDANDNCRRRAELERQRQQALRQAKPANAAGRGKRQV